MNRKRRGILSILLALVLLLGQVPAGVLANNDLTPVEPITVEENVQSEEKVRSLLEAYNGLDELDDDQLEGVMVDEDQEVRVLIEVAGDPLIVQAGANDQKVSDFTRSQLERREGEILNKQEVVQAAIEAQGVDAEVINEYTAVINAFAAKVKLKDLAKIDVIPGVVDIQVSNEYERPEPHMLTSNDQVKAPLAWETDYTGENTLLVVLDTGVDPNHKDFVMDEGVELAYTKSEMESLINKEGLPGRYYNDKVVYAYNYYDLNHVVQDTGSSQHGMHVAGTMAANEDVANGGIKGVAPGAQLASMKVFSNDMRYATTFSDIYVKAIDDAIKLGADAVNLSLGAPAGFNRENSIEQKALKNARDNGIVASISAGNERNIVNGGDKFGAGLAFSQNPDTGLIGSPSSNLSATTVASYDNSHLMAVLAKTNKVPEGLDENHKKALQEIVLVEANGAPSFSTLSGQELEYVLVGTGKAQEFEAVDVKGKVAVAVRGNTFTDTIANGMKAEAAAVIVYNHEAGGEGIVNMAGGDGSTIPFAFVRRSSGLALQAAQEADQSVRLVFSDGPLSTINPTGNQMSSFSTWGPTPDLRLKPEILAPGGEIYSTQNGNTYTTMSGTSMAAPHVAGGIGVVRQFVEEKMEEGVFPDMNKPEISNFVEVLLMNTASLMKDPNTGVLYSPRQQGAGLMNLENATSNLVTVTDVRAGNTSAGRAKLELGEVGNSRQSLLEVNNYSDETVLLTPRITVLEEVVEDGKLQERFRVVRSYPGRQVEVGPKGSAYAILNLNFTDVRNNSFAEGFVEFEDQDGNNRLSVPFIGFKGKWDEPRVLDTMNGYNLLANPDPNNAHNFSDLSASQESQFKASGFYQSGLFGGRILNPNKILIAPQNSLYNLFLGVGSVTPVVSQLRNAESMEYKILDEEGDTLRTLFKEYDVRKIFRLYANRNPFRFVNRGGFNGRLDGQLADDGSYTYRIESVVDFKNARPQHDDFHLVVDNQGPVFEKDENGNLVYQLNPETLELTFKVRDFIGEGLTHNDVAGLSSVSVYNRGQRKTEVYELEEGTLLDEETNLYEFTVDLSKSLEIGKKDVLEVNAMDDIFNQSKDSIVFNAEGTPTVVIEDETVPNLYLKSPELLNIYGDRDRIGMDTLDLDVNGYVWGWDRLDSVTLGGQEVPFVAKDIKVRDANFEYSGPGFEFMGTVTLEEGYHALQLEVKAEHKKDFGVGRRFFIDLTPPQVDGPSTLYTDTDKAKLSFDVLDNLNYIEVNRGDNFVDKFDNSNQGGFDASVHETVNDTVARLKEGVNRVQYTVKDYLYTTTYDVYVVSAYDVNIDELVETLAVANQVDTSLYLESSVKALVEAKKFAQDVLNKGTPTQEEVDEALEVLNAALAQLKEPASEEEKEPLRLALEEAKAVDTSLYTAESVEALNEAIAHAESVLDNPRVSSQEIADAIAKLQVAMASLEKLDPDLLAASEEAVSNLRDLLERAKEVDLDKYTDETAQALSQAVNQAEQVLAKETPLVGEVNQASADLRHALDNLEEKKLPPVVEARNEVIHVGEEVDVTTLFTAHDMDGNPLEVVIEGEVDNLQVGDYELVATAQSHGLETKASAWVSVLENDKTELLDKIAEAEAIDLDVKTYSSSSKDQLQAAVRQAKRVVENQNALKEEISQAVQTLDQAINGLEVVKEGWIVENGKKYYYENGRAKTGWFNVDGERYYANRRGEVQTGWLRQGLRRYYLLEDGSMATGWQRIGRHTYYFRSSGHMVTGVQRIDGSLHLFRLNGRWVRKLW